MRFSPTKLFHGLLYLAPVLFLTLVACGGGGGGSSSSNPPLAAYFTVGGTITNLTGSGLVLRNNGGDDLTVASGVTSYTFSTSIASGSSYNVSVLTHPNPPTQVCTVVSASGSIAGLNVTNANVTCTTAYTISGTISGDTTLGTGIGPILQNNGGDDLFIATLPAAGSAVPFIFITPVASGSPYAVTQLSQAKSPGQDCSTITGGGINNNGSGIVNANIIDVTITCTSAPIVPRSAYATNSTANTVSAYAIDGTGALTGIGSPVATGTEPYSVSVDPSGRYAYVANHSSNDISVYGINSGSGALTAKDANGAVANYQASIAAGTYPISVTVHPSGKFAYVANESSADISAYSINTTSGALSAIDANGALTGTTIATGTKPFAVTIDPTGKFAYVANYGNGSTASTISVYSINQTSGALTAGTSATAGTGPSSIAIDPYGKFLLVANNVSDDVMSYKINPDGTLTPADTITEVGGSKPRSIAIDPNTGIYVYVANAGTGNVAAYTINATDGTLTGGTTTPAGTLPFSVNVDPSGAYVYVANFTSLTAPPGSVSTYSIGALGALTAVVPTVATGNSPTSVTTTQ